jgi:GNAT superfamily N-acetyltransferase
LITYNDTLKDLPIDQLHNLFIAVGWWNDEPMQENIAKAFMQAWQNSTLVVSAWDGEGLVGVVRVLSDTVSRSIIHDLLVAPEYQGKGIGSELVRHCFVRYPNSEWLVGLDRKNMGFYKKLGFQDTLDKGIFLCIPCKLF